MLNFNRADGLKCFLSLIFIGLVFAPLLQIFFHIDLATLVQVFNAPNFQTSLVNSLMTTSLATAITVVIAFFLAYSTERVAIKGKLIFVSLILLPMLIPSISHGMGLILLFGNNGLMTNALGLDFTIYGFHGIVFGSILYAFPVAYLMFVNVMKYQDASPYEAAKVLGLNAWQRFLQIGFPFLRKPLISIVFAVFTLIVTDYGVPLMVGGKCTTIPVVMYQEVIGQLHFGKGAVYGSILLIPAVIAFFADLMNEERGNTGFMTKAFIPTKDIKNRIFAYSFCILVSLCTLLPIFAFLIMGFTESYPRNLSLSLVNLTKTLDLRAGEYLVNSLLIALSVSVFGIFIAFFTAYLSARMRSVTSRFLHLSAMTSAAIPGMVLGLAYVLTFKGSVVYGTIALLVMVNVVHFISSPYLMMYNALSKLNVNLEGVGHTLGISRALMIRDVFLPTCKGTMAEIFCYFFVNCMITISAVSFLATTANKPVALMINQFEAQMQIECAAIVSLAILVANLMVKSISSALQHRI